MTLHFNFFKPLFDFFKLNRYGNKKLIYCLVMTLFGSLVLALTETVIVALIQVLFLKTRIVQPSQSYPIYLSFLVNQSWITVVMILITAGASRSYGQYVTIHRATSLQDSLVTTLRGALVNHVLIEENSQDISPSKAQNLVGQTFLLTGQWALYLATAISGVIQLAGYLVLMFVLAPKQAIFSLSAISLIGIPIFVLLKKSRNKTRDIHKNAGDLVSGVQHILSNWQLVRIYKTAEAEAEKLNRGLHDMHKSLIQGSSINAFAACISPLFGLIIIIGVSIMGVNTFGLGSEVILPFLYLIIRFFQQFSVTSQTLGNVSHLQQYADISTNFIIDTRQNKSSLLSERTLSIKLPKDRIDLVRPAPGIEIKNLTIISNQRTVFSNLNLSIKKGTQVAIVGHSGSGKSLLLSSIMGIYKNYTGQILIDGKRVEEYSNSNLNCFGYVGANSFLISGSIRDNISYGTHRRIDDDEMWDILESVNLANDIRRLPQKLDHQLNELGDGLSVGQKSRICLARALATNAKILILDEATANLDRDNEDRIIDMLLHKKNQLTTLIVSHKSSTIRHADLVVNLDPPNWNDFVGKESPSC